MIDRITVEEAKELLASAHSKVWTLAAPPRVHLTASWEEIKLGLRPGDELWTYKTIADCETKSRIDKGIALVRWRRVIATVKTWTKYYWW